MFVKHFQWYYLFSKIAIPLLIRLLESSLVFSGVHTAKTLFAVLTNGLNKCEMVQKSIMCFSFSQSYERYKSI